MKRKIARERGLPLPEEEEAPEEEFDGETFLADHLNWVWEAFAKLSRTRLVNQAGPQPITILELDAYCTLEGIWTEEERRTLLQHITSLDIEWLKDQHEKISKSREESRKEAEQDAKRKAKNRGR